MPELNNDQELVGGTAGEPEERSFSPFFHAGVKGMRLKNKNVYQVRLLPAFDRSIQRTDPAFKASFVAYRDVNKMDPKTEKPAFTAWYYLVKGYEFFGEDGHTFLSPLTRAPREERGHDPMYDTAMTARNHVNPDYKFLVEKPKEGNTKRAPLPFPSVFGLINTLVSVSGQMDNRIVIVTKKSVDMLRQTLNMLAPRGSEIVTPAWEDYLFGDPTDPYTGLLAEVRETPFGDAGMKTSGFHFSRADDRLLDHYAYPFDPNTEVGRIILENRYNIGDLDNVTRIPSPEEILSIMVSDGTIPYDLIQEACGSRWTVPAQHAGRRHFPGTDAADEPSQFDEAAPAAPAPAAARPAAAPAAAARPAAPGAARPTPPGGAARPAAPGAARPAPPAPAAARPAAPGAARPAPPAPAANRPPAPGAGANRPAPPAPAAARPASPAAPAGRPAAPAAPRPAAPAAPRIVAPAPAPAPAPEPEAAAEVLEQLNEQELADLTAYDAAFSADPNSLTPEQMTYYGSLMDRRSALQAAGQ